MNKMCVYYNTLSDDDDDDDNILDIFNLVLFYFNGLNVINQNSVKVRVLISSPLNTHSEILRVTFAPQRTKKKIIIKTNR